MPYERSKQFVTRLSTDLVNILHKQYLIRYLREELLNNGKGYLETKPADTSKSHKKLWFGKTPG